jgi:ATP-dependent helicase HepA
MAWKLGDRLRHRFNPELGPGLVRAVEGRTLLVEFPDSASLLRLAADSEALAPLEVRRGCPARLLATGETVTVERAVGDGRICLADGREVGSHELWPLDHGASLVDRLAAGDVDPIEQLALRLDALHLEALREADTLGSFLGGRIRIFPHQLHVAERATRLQPVRWLLADEVGLGKTVEACLIMNHLMRRGRAERVLVVAPATLTIQWLGELWRKFHQVFVLLDDARLADVERELGAGFNPFAVHRRVVVSLELLGERRRLTEQAVEAGIDLLVVDEAHHLRRPAGHPGNLAYRAIRPIAALGRHVLLLTATPLDEDAHGFLRLLQLLRPEELPDDAALESRLESARPLPPCTSATRRADIGGLPPRAPRPFTVDDEAAWAPRLALERALRALPAADPLARRRKGERLRRALSSGAALDAVLDSSDRGMRELARAADEADPRLAWLARRGPEWKEARDKTLVFTAHRETLEQIRAAMSRRTQTRVAVFHEDLSPGQRDIEVAQFRLPGGPSMLVSTECGGEGRNFEFCTRLVLFDLPWSPIVVEQRIGRLDRIGRRRPVEIVYPRPPAGLDALVVELYESLGLFSRPLGGLERELARVRRAFETVALAPGDLPHATLFQRIVEHTRTASDRVARAARHELHRDPYRPELAAGILARVPAELEELTREVVLAAADLLGLHVEEHRAGSRHSIELGAASAVASLPGVPGGSSFLGSFDREATLEDESIDFFASGHPLVEGILAHLDESPLGRVGLLRVAGGGEHGFGLLALYRDGPRFAAVAVDAEGRSRPDWAERLARRPLRSRRVPAEAWTARPEWPELVRGLARTLEGRGRPVLLLAFQME